MTNNQTLLRINLTKKEIHREKLEANVIKKYLGGVGLAAKLLFDHLKNDVDSLSPKNLIVFAVGPLTGTSVPCTSRYVVCSKSPQTGIWGEANSGGFIGPMIRKAGLYAIAISGKSEKPVYVSICNADTEIRDASHLVGTSSYDTEHAIKKEVGQKFKVASIGPAGENLVKFASIINDGGNAAGRTGMGAVMGSKNLKAIAVFGDRKLGIKNPEKLGELSAELSRKLRASQKGLIAIGTPRYMMESEETGDLPIKYWTEGNFDAIEKISGEALEKFIKKRKTCYGCPIGCHKYTVSLDANSSREMTMPEYETIACFGSMCMNENLKSIIKANDLCNRYGVDTITTASLIAFSMECYEKGWISREQLGGIDLSWGNEEAIIEMVEKIVRREGFGDVLAEGIRYAAEKIGHNAREIAVHVKGLDLPAHDPRAFESLAVNYATSDRGGCHLHGWPHCIEQGVLVPDLGIKEKPDRFEWNGKADLVKKIQDWACVNNSLLMCVYAVAVNGGVTPSHQSEMLSYAMGWEMTVSKLMKIGERIFNLTRMFNVRLGISSEDDTLPSRILLEPRKTGGSAHHLPRFEQVRSRYYKARGWDRNGIPKPSKLDELRLKF